MTIADKQHALSAMMEAHTGYRPSREALDEWADELLSMVDDWATFRAAWYAVAEYRDRPGLASVRAAYQRLREQANREPVPPSPRPVDAAGQEQVADICRDIRAVLLADTRAPAAPGYRRENL